MTFKKIIIIFLLILCIFSFSSFSSVHAESVHPENINVVSSYSERMQADIDYLKLIFKNNNINNIDDLKQLFGSNSNYPFTYIYIEDAGHFNEWSQEAYFYASVSNISVGTNDYSYYGIQQNSFSLVYLYGVKYHTNDTNYLGHWENNNNGKFKAPLCWLCVRTLDLFTKDSSQIVANAVENVNKSINGINDKITADNSSQNDINLGTHNDEMSSSADSIKNSNLYSKFDNIIDKMDNAFTYNDDEVSTIPITFFGKSLYLRSDEISSFFKNNNLGFVVLLWQSILWFSLFYTMFIFCRKLYKAFSGGNPVDDVSSTLSNEDTKIVGGF